MLTPQVRALDREIAHLATVACLTLVTEPLLLLADTAIVGHLGTPQLAGLGIAGAVITTLLGVCIFLAYGTTASVARLIGAGRSAEAFAQGIDGLWLAVAVGSVVTVAGVPLAGRLVGLFGPAPAVAGYATAYLRIALLGAVPMLLVLAATGVLRGTKDLGTPLRVAVAANLANIVLNLVLVYPVGLGIRGSALGSLLAQTGAAAALVLVVVRVARAAGVGLRPDLPGIRRAAAVGVPLIVRTLLLRAALVLMTVGASHLGSGDLAAMQVALNVWNFLAFALDALGISAQTLIGQSLGRGDLRSTQHTVRRLLGWGLVLGIVTGLVLLACATVLGHLFTDDPGVLHRLTPVLLVAAAAQPAAGLVFTLDGLLIGAGDGGFLASAHLLVIVTFAPLAWWSVARAGSLTWLWVAFAVGFMGTRLVLLLLRIRGETWLRWGPAAG